MKFTEQKKMLKAKATELLKEYEGKKLGDVGEHLTEKSGHDYNYYMLPNGLEVLEEYYEFYEMGDLYGVIDGQEVLVGYTHNDNVIHVGEPTE